MKIKIKDYIQNLEAVTKGINKDTVEGTHLIFHKDGVLSHTGSSFINTDFPYIGDFSVDAALLMKFFNKCKISEVNIEVDEDKLCITRGKTEITFPITKTQIPTHEYMNVKDVAFKEVSEDLSNALSFAAPVALKKEITENTKVLCYVILHKDRVLSSDGVTLAEYTTKEDNTDTGMCIPAKELLKLKPNSIVSLGNNSKFVYLKNKEGLLYGFANPNIGGFDRILTMFDNKIKEVEQGSEVELSVEVEEMINNLSIFCDKTPTMVLANNKISVDFKGNTNYKQEADILYDEEPLELKITPSILKNILITNIMIVTKYTTRLHYGHMVSFTRDNCKYITNVTGGTNER